MKRILITSGFVALIASLVYAASETRTILDEQLPVTTTRTYDVGKYDRLSVQSVYEDASPSADTFSDGAKSAATITVANSADIDATQASVTVNVASNSTGALTDASITANGIVFKHGVNWSIGASSTTTATNIKNTVDAHPDFEATSSGSTVTIKAASVGTTANSWTITSSTEAALVLSSSNFSGGVDAESITIAGVTLTEGTDWETDSSSNTAALNIAAAINADSTLSALIIATNTFNVVHATAITAGIFPYGISSSSAAALAISPFSQGAESDIDVDEDTISSTTGHGFGTGLAIWLNVDSGSAPGGLTDGSTYYVIKMTENLYKVASSAENALSGTEVDITGVTGGGSFTFTPGNFVAGSAGFYWEASNDNSNWTDLTTSFSSVTYTADGTNLIDFSDYNYRYLRLNYTGPTAGALDLDIIINGKN